MSENKMTRKDAAALALKYAKAGIPAGPVACSWDEQKQRINKRPLTAHGHESFTTDGRALVELFNSARLRPGETFGVGLWPGPAGFVVLDLDVGRHDGIKALADLEHEHGELPDRAIVLTASGGEHHWFAKPEGAQVGNAGMAPGIDVRADAGWVVAPGTVTPWGSWELAEGAELTSGGVLNGWAADRLAQGPAPSPGTGRWEELDRADLHPGERAALELLESLGGHSAYRASDGTLRLTRPGKDSGTSAQISWNGPDVVQVFTSDWEGLPPGTYDTDSLRRHAELRTMIDDPPTGQVAAVGGIEARLTELGITDPLVRRYAREEMARSEARRAVRRTCEADAPATTTLRDLLAEPDEATSWRVKGLIPAGANVLIVAQAKAGKTTLVGNLVRSLVDWCPLLTEGVTDVGDLGTVAPLLDGETVAVIDLELDRRTIRRWLRDQGITNTDRVLVESLRGRVGNFDIQDPARRAAWAAHLAERGVRVLIVDCLGPLLAHYGAEENSNTEVGQVLAALESLKREAGIEEVVLVHHAGHNGERTRGASRLRDWPDVEIRLMIEGAEDPRYEPAPDAPRYIAARGRDVSLRERKLAFDSVTRRLTLAAEGGNRAQARNAAQRQMLLEKIGKRPGASQKELCGTAPKLRGVLAELVAEGLVHTSKGPRGAILHALADDCGRPHDCPGTRVIEGQVIEP